VKVRRRVIAVQDRDGNSEEAADDGHAAMLYRAVTQASPIVRRCSGDSPPRKSGSGRVPVTGFGDSALISRPRLVHCHRILSPNPGRRQGRRG
jgi:hypothetical protein